MAIKAVGRMQAVPVSLQKRFLKKPLPKEIPHTLFQDSVNNLRILEPRSADLKTILMRAVSQGESIEKLIDESLKNSSDKETVKKIASKALIHKALLEKTHLPLMTSQAKKLGLDKANTQSILQAIEELETSELKNLDLCYLHLIKEEIKAILDVPKERHNLHPLETLKICITATQSLNTAKESESIYLRADDIKLPRSVVINPENKSFAILSKKYGKLHGEGGFKKVSDAVKVALNGCEVECAKRMARLVNKTGRRISKTEIRNEKRYGDIDTIVHYKAKYDRKAEKTTILQEAYDHDLYIFTSYTPENVRKSLTFEELVGVLSMLGEKLQTMHHDGRVHRDLKAKNVLFRRDQMGAIDIKICDFGHTDSPINESIMQQKIKNHATVRYSGPEVFHFSPGNVNPFEQQKALDMYGLGSIVYELLFIKPTPWAHDVWVAIKKNKDHEAAKVRAIALQKNAPQALLEESRKADNPFRKELIEIMAKLLEPDYQKRMQIDEFVTAILSLKARLQAIAP